ncbi:MAG: UDP-N-acetylmuramoyl-tripeptide--D-alanyl-D-alanine ligase [Clostridia bacterium]|nr:UDP-N-acetylmuramoyl-tripeptide--D-alanyl-D-alanine ligase [Clostridia bacterium]
MTAELRIPITLGDISRAIGNKRADLGQGREQIGNFPVKRIVTDSREALAGDLFVALRGERFNGNDYISEAGARGAFTLSDENKNADIFVTSALMALGDIAALYKSRLKNLVTTVGITGSIGKTTTKSFLASVLSRHMRVHATRGNENNLLGVPLTVLSAPSDTELLIIEAGMNHAGELSEISRMITPDLAVITNIGTAHIGNFGTRQAIAKAKLELLEHAAVGASLFVPYGEPLLSAASAITVAEGYEKRADFSIVRERASAHLSGDFYKRDERLFGFSTSITAEQLLPILGLAFAVCHNLGMQPSEISTATAYLSDTDTRLRSFKVGELTVIDDAYNSSLEALKGALLHLSGIDARPRCALLGDILELGDMAEAIHYEAGRLAAESLDMLYVCGEYKNAVIRGARESGLAAKNIRVLESTDPDEIASVIKAELVRGVLLIKGSHATGLYRVPRILLKYGG